MGGSLDTGEMLQILEQFPEYRSCSTFVETGTYEGETISKMARMFPACHTIELSEFYHNLSKSRYGHLNISFHLGDSSEVLKSLCRTVTDNSVFFLDAHFSSGKTARGSKDVPLVEELGVISARNKSDLIIVDDVRLFGWRGGEDWGDISTEAILQALHPRVPKHHFVKNDRLFILLEAPQVSESCGSTPPPREIPAALRNQFSMNGAMRIVYEYYDSSGSDRGPKVYTIKEITTLMYQVFLGATVGYGITDLYLYDALKAFPIKGNEAVVMGSQTPWYESVALAYGAQSVLTVEYQPIISEHPLVKALTPAQVPPPTRTYDVGFSISSFEHDGLGRYGDPISPDADLAAMRHMRSLISPGGILFLSVPVGIDTLVWNAHRIYGRRRLPLLLKDWSLVGSFGMSDMLMDSEGLNQPILVLRNDFPLS
jgi:hypothetical protein